MYYKNELNENADQITATLKILENTELTVSERGAIYAIQRKLNSDYNEILSGFSN